MNKAPSSQVDGESRESRLYLKTSRLVRESKIIPVNRIFFQDNLLIHFLRLKLNHHYPVLVDIDLRGAKVHPGELKITVALYRRRIGKESSDGIVSNKKFIWTLHLVLLIVIYPLESSYLLHIERIIAKDEELERGAIRNCPLRAESKALIVLNQRIIKSMCLVEVLKKHSKCVFEGGSIGYEFETRYVPVGFDLGGSLSNQSRASPSREKGKSISLKPRLLSYKIVGIDSVGQPIDILIPSMGASNIEAIVRFARPFDTTFILYYVLSYVDRMPPKRMSTSEAPAMTQAAIRKLVTDSCYADLEAQPLNIGQILNDST
ncbi:hypothetical protein Tco_0001832 [Tanacetum coccineum]